MYLTKLTDETIKVYKAEHEKLKVSVFPLILEKLKKECLFAVIKENNKYIPEALKLGAKVFYVKKEM